MAYKGKICLLFTAIALWMATGNTSVQAQLWLNFAHPENPHQRSPLPPMAFQELFDGPNETITIPVVVVLMDFVDLEADRAVNSAERFYELIFGQGQAGSDLTVREYFRHISNGRINITPAEEFRDVDNDGMIGWVSATDVNFNSDLEAKRAEAVRLADLFMDFSQYDTNDDTIITTRELILFMVGPGDGGGATRATDPAVIEVENGQFSVRLPVGALGETHGAFSFAHEMAHPYFGLEDIYHKCPCGSQPNCDDCDECEVWKLTDGYICEVLSDDCAFPENSNCSCPDALDATRNETVTGNTAELPESTPGAACGFNNGLNSRTAWYEVYGNGNVFTATICSFGTSFDTRISVFCNGCDEMTCVASNDNDPNCAASLASTVTWCTRPGAAYLIAVHGTNGTAGVFRLQVSDTGQGCNSVADCGLAAFYGRHWYPPVPTGATLMAVEPTSENAETNSETVISLDPWSKMHLGFTKPKVIRSDGRYTIFSEEPIRTFAEQETQPEAFIVYDSQRPPFGRFHEYFIIEARSDPDLADRGLAVWLVNERVSPFPSGQTNYRRVNRLIKRGGHNVGQGNLFWDGGSPFYYDLTADSEPRNSSWSDGQPSYIGIYDVSESGSTMTFSIQIPPIFVDWSSQGSAETGSQSEPFLDFPDALESILLPPRTIMIAGGNYQGPMTLSKPCTIRYWKNGDAVIGN